MQARSGHGGNSHPSWIQSFEFNPGDGGNSSLRNASIYLQYNMVSQARSQCKFLPPFQNLEPLTFVSSFIRANAGCHLIMVNRLFSHILLNSPFKTVHNFSLEIT
jgi:hypothetical protein